MKEQEHTAPKKHNRKNWLIALLSVCCLLVIIFGFKWRYNISFWFGAKLAVTAMNLGTPRWIDETTRLDSVKVSKKSMNSYSVLKLDSDTDIELLKRDLGPYLVNFVKTDHDLAPLRFLEWTVTYNYYDMEGNPLFRCEITPEMYKRQKDE